MHSYRWRPEARGARRAYGGVVGAGGERVAARVEADRVHVSVVRVELLHPAAGPHVPNVRSTITALPIHSGSHEMQMIDTNTDMID